MERMIWKHFLKCFPREENTAWCWALGFGQGGNYMNISHCSSGGKWDRVFDNEHEIRLMTGPNCQERRIPQLEVSPVLDGLSPNPPTWCCSSPSDGNRACIDLQQLHTIVSVPELSHGMPVVPTVLQLWAPPQQSIHSVKPTVIKFIPWTQNCRGCCCFSLPTRAVKHSLLMLEVS